MKIAVGLTNSRATIGFGLFKLRSAFPSEFETTRGWNGAACSRTKHWIQASSTTCHGRLGFNSGIFVLLFPKSEKTLLMISPGPGPIATIAADFSRTTRQLCVPGFRLKLQLCLPFLRPTTVSHATVLARKWWNWSPGKHQEEIHNSHIAEYQSARCCGNQDLDAAAASSFKLHHTFVFHLFFYGFIAKTHITWQKYSHCMRKTGFWINEQPTVDDPPARSTWPGTTEGVLIVQRRKREPG